MTSSQARIRVRRAQQSALFLLPVALLIGALLLLAPALHAQETSPTVTPSQLAIAAQRGGVESRQVLVQSDGALTSLDFVAQDLSSSDGASVLPAAAIDMVLPLTGSLASPLTMDLMVDLAKVAPGSYAGDALLLLDGASQWISLRVLVKDPPWVALLVLLTGVALGVGLNAYRTRLAPRDAKLVEISDLLREVEADQDLRSGGRGAVFRRRIDLHVADAGAAVRGAAWDDAQRFVDLARGVLDVWRRERDGWRKVFDRQAALRQELTADARFRDDRSPYVADLRLAVDEAAEQAVEEALAPALDGTPESVSHVTRLDERLKRINELMLIYENEFGDIKRVQETLAGAEGEQAQSVRAQLDLLTNELRQVRPWSDSNALSLLSDLHVRIKRTALEAAGALAPASPETQDKPSPAAAPMPAGSAARPLTWPQLEFVATPRQIQQARSRKFIFQYASFAVAVALLAGAGFQELYLSSATFGSNPWADYFTLLAWGFGAEATRGAITELVRGWDVPLLGNSRNVAG